jgi:hypothetical protein
LADQQKRSDGFNADQRGPSSNIPAPQVVVRLDLIANDGESHPKFIGCFAQERAIRPAHHIRASGGEERDQHNGSIESAHVP